MIEFAENKGFKEATVTINAKHDQRMLKHIRNNDRVNFDDKELASKLFERLPKEVAELSGWKRNSLDSRFRFYRYDPGQRFRPHEDGSVTVGSLVSHFTLLIYLNDDFSGGDTNFYTPRMRGTKSIIVDSVKPVVGDALIFQHEWRHEGEEILSGRKYVLRTDILYSPE